MSARNSPDQPGAEELKARAARLGLYGVLDHWAEVKGEPWLEHLIGYEETERHKRSLERRIQAAKIGRFKPMADFDWSWPTKVDRELIDEVFGLEFIDEPSNVILMGPNGVGKTTIAQNLAHQAVLGGHTVRFITASELLNELSAQDGPSALTRQLRSFSRPSVLVIDEVGYLSYNTRHADLLFDIITRRNQVRATIVTTNRPFAEWNEVFPNSSSVVALVDRLVHKAEIIQIKGESYRLKEAKERAERKRLERTKRRKTKRTKRQEGSS